MGIKNEKNRLLMRKSKKLEPLKFEWNDPCWCQSNKKHKNAMVDKRLRMVRVDKPYNAEAERFNHAHLPIFLDKRYFLNY